MFLDALPLSEQKARETDAVVLAFVGDAVYSLFVRERLTVSVLKKSGELSRLAANRVKATAQADTVDKLLPLFTEEETAIYKRARNAKKSSTAKNAGVIEYHKSTGFEAVLGYLYLTGKTERLNELLKLGEENEN